ncbi:hypothetical protein [Variovorax rhizosphaerae]|uniref:Uncharacterized protein n=1 Tax=Variovorax rhizosphaerae TaxID=1836200 RepID=A0ABU8WSD5_9BURK
MKINLTNPGGITFLAVMHDNDCPGAHGDPANCVCEPDIMMHTDAELFRASVRRNRAQRRAAERAERQATAKAKGGTS